MTEKVLVAGLAIAFVLFVSNATAGPPGANVYVPPQTQQTTANDQKNPDLSNQGHDQGNAASPNVTTNGRPPAASDPQRRLSIQQRRAMRACMANCIAAGMTGPFCSHSCIPD